VTSHGAAGDDATAALWNHQRALTAAIEATKQAVSDRRDRGMTNCWRHPVAGGAACGLVGYSLSADDSGHLLVQATLLLCGAGDLRQFG
jgi:hypothetical protein